MSKKILSGFFETQQIDYIMIANSNFRRLRYVSISSPEIGSQNYEDVPGFESLRKLQKRINSSYE